MIRWLWFSLVILHIYGNWCSGFTETNNHNLLEEAIKGLANAVEFFNKNTANIILDGVFGLRVAEGQIDEAIKHIRRSKVQPAQNVLPLLASLKLRIQSVAQKCMPALEKLNSDYFWWFYNAIDKPYHVPYIPRHAEPYRLQGNETSNYTEAEGDQCFGEIMGVHTNIERESNKCMTSEFCLNMMTGKWRRDYALTHQLLYFIEAQHSECTDNLEAILGKGSMETFQQTFCNQIYTEAQHNIVYKLENFFTQDLFLEQCMLCGIIGFEDFLSPDWLKLVLSWQDPSGCFTNQQYDEYMSSFRNPTLRRLLYERKLNDGCLSHKTGLGTGLLGLYVRYLVEHQGTFPQRLSNN